MEMQIQQEMVKDIWALTREFDASWISFRYREANKIIDGLALLGKDNLFFV